MARADRRCVPVFATILFFSFLLAGMAAHGGPLPDLVVTALSEPPPYVLPGGNFSATDTTRNAGTAQTVNYPVNTVYFLSVDGRAQGAIQVGSRIPGMIAPGAENTGTVRLFVPANAQAGAYYLVSCADWGNLEPEGNESNNCRASGGRVSVGYPDLVVTAVSNPPATAELGTTVTVTATVRNNGFIPSNPSRIVYNVTVDRTSIAGDFGSRQLPSIPAGGEITDTLSRPVYLFPGSYYLIACADGAREVGESNESNNCRVSAASMAMGAPDLVVAALSEPPQAAAPGSSIAITDTTRNIGNSTTAQSSVTRFLLSVNTSPAGEVPRSLYPGYRHVGVVPRGGDNTWTTETMVTSETPPGSYHLLGCADNTGILREVNEYNNCRASAGRVTVGRADLLVTAISNPPASVPPGGTFGVTDTVRNAGNAQAAMPSVTWFYLSTSPVPGTAVRVGERYVGKLAPGTDNTGSVIATVPPNAPPGTFYLLACADSGNSVAESDESNNCRISATQVQVGILPAKTPFPGRLVPGPLKESPEPLKPFRKLPPP